MAGNEAKIIGNMLESCFPYIDFWIAQCNGQDETEQIVQDFFNEKKIPGFTYKTEWVNPGVNSDHLIQTCREANHSCDWFLRVDADEKIVVESDFNWKILDDLSIQSFDVVARNGLTSWFRNRIWNAKLPWRFKHDKRHECIILPGCGPTDEEFQRVTLDAGFYHFITSAGKSYENPTKFVIDALELELQQVIKKSMTSDLYHLFYVAKSYYDAVMVGDFPFGQDHKKEFARRSVFYFLQYEKLMASQMHHEMLYYARLCLGNMFNFLEQTTEAEESFLRCDLCCLPRNEHVYDLALLYLKNGRFEKMFEQTIKLVDERRKNPFPELSFLINNNLYIDTGRGGIELHNEALKILGQIS